MTPQSSFMVHAPIRAGREDELRALLAEMNRAPGAADPSNALFPFGEFEGLHVARFLVVEDLAPDDVSAYGVAPERRPPSLAFLGYCDGSAGGFLAEAVQRAKPGLRRIFSFCSDFGPDTDLLRWMREHEQPSAATYVNWIGRTVPQVHEESALRDALAAYAESEHAALAALPPREARARIVEYADGLRAQGRITLTPPGPTPPDWWIRNVLDAVAVPVVLLLLAPFLILYLPVFVIQLRARERTDAEIAPRPDPHHVRALARLEDHDVTNQFSALGSVKPGRFRRWLLIFLLRVLDYTARHIYNRGRLTRVQTIHFARWVFIDGGRRLLFASNYDGSLESYMDDFINKVAWGLNLVFSNGVGYPHTDWLIVGGAKEEQKFKYYLRRHELPTEVWYKAYPGLTAVDLARNARIREGIERASMSDAEIREWLALL